MENPQFNQAGYCRFRSKYGGKVRLSKETWEIKTSKPERACLIYNFDRIRQTLSDPDVIRKSTQNVRSKIYYRSFPGIKIRKNVEVPFKNYLAVVVDKKTLDSDNLYNR